MPLKFILYRVKCLSFLRNCQIVFPNTSYRLFSEVLKVVAYNSQHILLEGFSTSLFFFSLIRDIQKKGIKIFSKTNKKLEVDKPSVLSK